MKKMSYSLSGMILGGAMAALLSGCGGGNDAVKTAYLVDSNVGGVAYQCGSQSGVTGTDGSFRFQDGAACTFSIGAAQFTVNADKLSANKRISPYDIFSEDDEKAVNLARLLQTLDSDGNPENGISITEQVRNQIQSQIRFDANFEGDMTTAMNQVRAQIQGMEARQVRTRVQALEHLAQNVDTPETYSTFERIAEIDAATISGATGTDKARVVAQMIAKYFNDVNDLTTGYSIADWVLGGSTFTGVDDANITHYNPYILEIPSPDGSKTMIVEVCNKTHAGGAINGSVIPGGEGHGPALPCEIAVYTDTATGKIYVDILDPVGSFAIFFNDMGNNPLLSAMALQVKTEIKLISYVGLDTAAIAYEKKSTPLGATFTEAEIDAMDNQYLKYTYAINTADANWSAATTTAAKRALAADAAKKLIANMTVNIPFGYDSTFASPYTPAGSYGINGTDLNATLVGSATYPLSANGYWRSARKAPLSVPRDVNTSAYGFMYTVEACSPTYAKQALSMGGDSRDHATALPCQMTFYIDDADPAAPKLKVVVLNPEFMFQTLFKDKLAGLSDQEKTTLSAMATTVKNDLVSITRYTMDHSGIGWIIANP